MAKKRKEEGYPPLSQLQTELYQTREALTRAYHLFNCVGDPELVEACIYHINALQCKQNYLLRCIKMRTGQPISKPVTMKAVVKEPTKTAESEAIAAGSMNGGKLCQW